MVTTCLPGRVADAGDEEVGVDVALGDCAAAVIIESNVSALVNRSECFAAIKVIDRQNQFSDLKTTSTCDSKDAAFDACVNSNAARSAIVLARLFLRVEERF